MTKPPGPLVVVPEGFALTMMRSGSRRWAPPVSALRSFSVLVEVVQERARLSGRLDLVLEEDVASRLTLVAVEGDVLVLVGLDHGTLEGRTEERALRA